MLRALKILRNEFRNRTFFEFLGVVFAALFTFDKVNIYISDLTRDEFPEIVCEFNDEIEKGDLNELNRIREKYESPPWEFSCHVYDHVTDFFWYKDKEDVIAHITWAYYSPHRNRSIKLGAKEAELKFGLTDEGYRGKRLLPAALVKFQKYLKSRGYERVFASILETNLPSIKATERSGFRFDKKIYSVKILGFRITKRYRYKNSRV